MRNKQGYTMIELVVCLILVTVVLFAAFKLFSKWQDRFINQDTVISSAINRNNAFTILNELVSDAPALQIIDDNTVTLGNHIISYDDDGIYLNSSIICYCSVSSMSLDGRRLLITVGGDVWCFRNIRKEI